MPIHGIRATYQPFSFQERLAPLQMMKEEYDKVNEGLATLGETASQYYQYLDAGSKQAVDQYNATLQSVAGDLAASGMKAVNRNTLYALKRQFSSQIKPIQDAAKTVGALQDTVREMQLKDPTLIVQSVPSVTDIMNNPNAAPSVVSGAQLMKEGAAAALTLPGVDYASIQRYLSGDTSAIPGIENTMQNIADNYGVSTDQARQWIARGILGGLGERATQLDAAKQKMDMELAKSKELARYQAGLQAGLAKTRANEQIRVAEVKAGLKGTTGNGKSGASYTTQIGNVVYAKGTQERMLGSVKDAEDLMSKTKATYKGFEDLSDENKIRVLRSLGAKLDKNASSAAIEDAMLQYINELNNYTYMEYKKKDDVSSKDDEFFLIPKKVIRDTYSEDSGEDDFYLNSGE